MHDSSLFVDTNVFLRFLVDDNAEMGSECRELIERAESGEFTLHTSHLALGEIVWTLRSHYGLSRVDVAAALQSLLTLRSLRVEHRDMLSAVLDLYTSTNVDFIDAYHAMDAQRQGFTSVISYDRDFDRLPVGRTEPGQALA